MYSKVQDAGWDREQFLSDIMNYVVDKKSPTSEDKNYSNTVKTYGDILIKNGNDQKQKLKSD